MKKISEHVSYKEGVYSRTAERRDLDNTPNADQLKCMMEIAIRRILPYIYQYYLLMMLQY